MRVRVDGSKCQGHTLCAMLAPDAFELADLDRHANAISHAVPEEQRPMFSRPRSLARSRRSWCPRTDRS